VSPSISSAVREALFLLQTLEREGGITYLYGIAGSGKSTLLEAFIRRARAEGATVIRLDVRRYDRLRPACSQLAIATGGYRFTAGCCAAARQHGREVVVALDTCECSV
jgi:hypothetical protein